MECNQFVFRQSGSCHDSQVMLGRAHFSSVTLSLLITGWITSVRFRVTAGRVLYVALPRPAVKPLQSAVTWVHTGIFLGIKRPGRESHHQNLVTKYVEHYLHLPYTFSWCGA